MFFSWNYICVIYLRWPSGNSNRVLTKHRYICICVFIRTPGDNSENNNYYGKIIIIGTIVKKKKHHAFDTSMWKTSVCVVRPNTRGHHVCTCSSVLLQLTQPARYIPVYMLWPRTPEIRDIAAVYRWNKIYVCAACATTQTRLVVLLYR